MQFQQVVYKRAKTPFFTTGEIERSFRRLGVNSVQVSGVLNRAVKRDDLIRLRSGVFCLPKKHRKRLISPYELLEKLDPMAYLSHVTALSHYELIPEAVGQITALSVKTINGQEVFDTPVGRYKFFKVPREVTSFGIDMVVLAAGISYRIATPLKAILDYAYLRKIVWKSREHLYHDLRIDEDEADKINWKDLKEYESKFNSPFMNEVCENLNV